MKKILLSSSFYTYIKLRSRHLSNGISRIWSQNSNRFDRSQCVYLQWPSKEAGAHGKDALDRGYLWTPGTRGLMFQFLGCQCSITFLIASAGLRAPGRGQRNPGFLFQFKRSRATPQPHDETIRSTKQAKIRKRSPESLPWKEAGWDPKLTLTWQHSLFCCTGLCVCVCACVSLHLSHQLADIFLRKFLFT